MDLLLEKFVTHFDDLYGDCTDKFKEEDGRRYFLLYLRPVINGTGNYYIESRTRNMERTDVIVDYHGERLVIELKIWRGNAYNERGEQQLIDYLEHYHLSENTRKNFSLNKEVLVKSRISCYHHCRHKNSKILFKSTYLSFNISENLCLFQIFYNSIGFLGRCRYFSRFFTGSGDITVGFSETWKKEVVL